MKLAALLLCSFSLFAQEGERRFRLTNLTAERSRQELATVLRVVNKSNNLSLDPTAGVLTVAGSPPQLATAEWLVAHLDTAPGGAPGPQNFRPDELSPDSFLIYTLPASFSNVGLQEMITTLRTVADIQLVYLVSESKTIVLRADQDYMAMATFILDNMTKAGQPIQELPIKRDRTGADVMVALPLRTPGSSLHIQEIITTLRTVLDVMRVYQVTETGKLTLRVPQKDLPNIEWLVARMERTSPEAGDNERGMPGGADDLVRVFYLKNGTSSKRINELAKSIRSPTGITKAYWQTDTPLIVARGKGDMIASAARTIAASGETAP